MRGGGGTLHLQHIFLFVVGASGILRKINFLRISKIYLGFSIKFFVFKNFVFKVEFTGYLPFVCFKYNNE